MAHNKYTPPAKTHEKKTTHKERKEIHKKWDDERVEGQPQQVPAEEIQPTAEDKTQLKRLGLIAGLAIVLLLFFMYYMFAWK
jgi:hypothetical protein